MPPTRLFFHRLYMAGDFEIGGSDGKIVDRKGGEGKRKGKE